jgi:acetylxylan esterase
MKAPILAGLLSAFVAVAVATNLDERQGGCAPVHILVARGSQEPEGEGATGRLATQVKKDIPGATSEAINYPAKLSPYPQSEAQGVQACKDQMTAYAKKCPNSKLVLMGYSQVWLSLIQ